MLGIIIVVLVICALVAIIFGKESAQKLFGCFTGVGIAIFLVVATLFGLLVAYNWKHTATPGSSPTYQTTPVAPYGQQTVQNSAPVLLDISCQPLNAKNGAKYHLEPGCGIFVSHVFPGGPAAAAGILSGDFISKADDQWLTTSYSIQQAEAAHRAGDTMVLTVLRNGYQYNVRVQL